MKFLVDAMLGKLARFLRIFGYDTIYANDLEGVLNLNPIPDEKLKLYAEKEERIVLTRDFVFYKTLERNGIFLEGEGIYNYLNQLKTKLGLKYEFEIKQARCSLCNNPLKLIDDKFKIQNKVLEETYRYYDEFYKCVNPQCLKVFWNGPHIQDILSKIKREVNS